LPFEESKVDEIRSVLIVGAGAVGSVVAATIHRSRPGSAMLLANAARRARLQSEGLVINGERLELPLVSTNEPFPRGQEPGLAIVAVKNHQLPGAIAEMAPLVGAGTLILSLMNGIASEDDLAAAFGREKVLFAMIIGIDAVRELDRTTCTVGGTINFGEARNIPGSWDERVRRIASFFDAVGLKYAVPEDMVRTLWYKLMVNVGINQASAVLRAPYSVFQRVAEARRVMDAAMLELVAISRLRGTGLSEADLTSWYKTLDSLSPGGKTSMLQDVEAGRKTEVEIFAGTVIALGQESGLPTPVNRLLYDLIRTIELTR
jgi:2-dehydropantoate 2-reductase